MKGLIVYKSRYGAAAQYAKWLSETLSIPAVELKDMTEEMLRNSSYIIAGSSIYMGKILLKDWLESNTTLLQSKNLFFYIVGAAPPSQATKTAQYFTDNIPSSLLRKDKCFYLQGKSIHSELNWLDKFLLKAGAMFAPTPADKKAMLTEFNAIQRENLNEILKAIASVKQERCNV